MSTDRIRTALLAELHQALAQRADTTMEEERLLDRSAAALRTALSEPADGPAAVTSQTSDGYHTFEELYEHRHALFLALIKAAPDGCFTRSWKHNDGEPCFGGDEWFIVSGQLPGSLQISYHLPRCLWDAAATAGATEVEQSGPWDGHTAVDVVNRLLGYAVLARCGNHSADASRMVSPAEGKVAELVAELRSLAVPLAMHIPTVAASVTRAAELLERQAAPVPVPVADRLPGPEDCDKEDYCWRWNAIAGSWARQPISRRWYEFESHWLPAHALPLPASGGEVE